MANTSIDGSFSAIRCRGACKRTFVQRSASRAVRAGFRVFALAGTSKSVSPGTGVPRFVFFIPPPPVPGRPDQPVDTFDALRHEYVVDVAFPITDANDVRVFAVGLEGYQLFMACAPFHAFLVRNGQFLALCPLARFFGWSNPGLHAQH